MKLSFQDGSSNHTRDRYRRGSLTDTLAGNTAPPAVVLLSPPESQLGLQLRMDGSELLL